MSKLSIGIVGLPNVGKSTLFKLLTKQEVNIANYPFSTINPNIGMVPVPDKRLDKLAKLVNKDRKIPAVIEFYDIAGLVKGAYKGEGLGNRFLGQIREVSAILIVLRSFFDADIIHVEEKIDPLQDLEIINNELAQKDAENKESENLLTAKKQIYLLNGEEKNISQRLKEKISSLGASYIVANLIKEPDLSHLIVEAYKILDLISFYTIGEEEIRAWTVVNGTVAVKAAGVIHGDFERKFVKAEVINWQKLLEASSWQSARSKGWLRLEGKDYLLQDGDVIFFHHG